MQTVLSILLFEGRKKSTAARLVSSLEKFGDKVEIIGHLKNNAKIDGRVNLLLLDDRQKFYTVARRLAKGKYLLFLSDDAELDEIGFNTLIDNLNKCNEDIVLFEKPDTRNCFLVKSALIKNEVDESYYDAETFYTLTSIVAAESIKKIDCRPFTFAYDLDLFAATHFYKQYSRSVTEAITQANKIKQTLKPVRYKAVFDALCGAVVAGYMGGIYLLTKRLTTAQKFCEADSKFKETMPKLYVIADEKIGDGDLDALRQRKFKMVSIPLFFKIRSALKKDLIL
ncbi:MAG: hypothetical protein K2N47_02250 [Clostridia bacterium]|nr:hypothetical protein [Clostridia bacterium]